MKSFTSIIILLLMVGCTPEGKKPASYFDQSPVIGEICLNGTKYLRFNTYTSLGGITPKYVNGVIETCK